MGKFREFNDKVAIKVTKAVGSMRCAYIFAAIALISLPAAILSGSVIIIISWIAQTFLQLVLLSIIMVGQNVQSKESEEHLQTMLDHISKENIKILKELKSHR
ncbi:MAG: hypothetical protein HGA54_05955 [Actinobacteria bacterium]|nr:hypothetical protein [Actinomycetota bacterium]